LDKEAQEIVGAQDGIRCKGITSPSMTPQCITTMVSQHQLTQECQCTLLATKQQIKVSTEMERLLEKTTEEEAMPPQQLIQDQVSTMLLIQQSAPRADQLILSLHHRDSINNHKAIALETK
jgi:hypothetical protein